MKTETEQAAGRIGRRHFLVGGAAAAATGVVAGATTVEADEGGGFRRCPFGHHKLPDPILGGVDLTGAGLPAPYDGVIHVWIPGPDGNALPFSGLAAQGKNVEPNTILNFRGEVAYALIAGHARGSDGVDYGLELDVRSFEGDYIVGGEECHGTFTFY